MKNIFVIESDITKSDVDAIVNAANPQMLGGGGVDGAVHRAAGPALLEACRKVKEVNGIRCPTGQARITAAGRLHCRYVIHTVGPVYQQVTNPKELLQCAYLSSLRLALKNHCRSIAFPAISCGVYGYPHREAAETALAACSREEFKQLTIYICLADKQMLSVWLDAENSILP
ncbi:O-acetyl-ADP-ribose deacetylase [Psychromonas ossibalaenae]|uniref:O-acetyl-ADP-ribose deacetylase n=1 Tax=Psychromonas ossibalaenae TaxID=444922 RepID=UPI0003766814|nr:O-acetyl-ADP-ribose deacetylase [Psychromonas ossibalaenae]